MSCCSASTSTVEAVLARRSRDVIGPIDTIRAPAGGSHADSSRKRTVELEVKVT